MIRSINQNRLLKILFFQLAAVSHATGSSDWYRPVMVKQVKIPSFLFQQWPRETCSKAEHSQGQATGSPSELGAKRVTSKVLFLRALF